MVLVFAVYYRWAGLDLSPFGVDIDVYTRGARAVLAGEDLYTVQIHGLLFTYSPFAAVTFVPLLAFSTEVGHLVLTALSAVAYIVVVATVARRLALPRAIAALVAVGGLAAEPFLRGMLLGQVNLLLVAMVVTDLLVLRASRRGFLVGVAAGVKLVPGIFVLYFVLQRDWKSLGRSAIGFGASVVIGAAFAPQATWRYWTGGFMTMNKFGESSVFAADNQSLSAFLMRLLHAADLPLVVTAVGCLVGLTLGVGAAWIQLRRGDRVAAVVCLAVGGLLASPVSWSHHWVWVVVVVLVLVHRRQLVSAWLVGILFWIGPFWMLPLGGFRELGLSTAQQVVGGSYVLAGVVILAQLCRPARPSASPQVSSPLEVSGPLQEGEPEPAPNGVPARSREREPAVSPSAG